MSIKRSELFEHMDTMLEISRTSNARLALLVIKIRQMRDINLSYGYQFGDAVNEKIALMIGNISRLNDHIFSIRNNEFIMILNDINNNGQAELAANRLINDIQRPLEINGTQANIKINIGIAIAPDHGTSADALLKAADMALTETMEGQSQYHIYKDHESKKKPANIILEQDLRQAIHNDELTILYQPKVDLIHRNAIGVEALSRWYSPVHGNVPPDIFIAVAESSDLIQPQTKWLFNNALRQYSACGIDKYTGMSLSLNLSPNLLQNDDITHIINSSLNMWDINPQNIILEITESAIMVNPEKCLKILTSIHDSGIRLSIDDFGTGYSSLAYLKKLPVDELKIDRSFVMNMENNKGDEKIVHSIIELAHNFDLVVVAEGIESQHALDMLTHYGCDFAQGFFIAKPMPGDDLLKWIENYNSHNKEKSEYNNI